LNNRLVNIILSAVFFTAVFPNAAPAQINIEQKRSQLENKGWGADLELYLTVNQGNTELVQFDNISSLAHRSDPHMGFLLLNFSTGESAGERILDKGMGHLRYNKMLNPTMFWEVFTQLEYDEFTLLELRWLLGSGPRIVLADQKKVNAALGVALMREYEELNLHRDDGRTVKECAYLISSYLDVSLSINNIITFSNTVYFQPTLKDVDNFKVLNDASLTFQIINILSFKVTLNLKYDSQPPPEVKNLDLQLKNGVVVRL